MERCVDYLQVVLTFDYLGVDAQRMYFVQVRLVDVLADELNERRIALELHVFHLHLAHLVDDAFVVRSQHLRPVFPISLVAVILLRVVARRYIHAGLTPQVTNGIRALGRGPHIVEQIDLNAVGREDVRHGLGELTTVVSAIVTHDHRDIFLALEVFLQIVGKALRSHAHRIDVHTVRTRAHDAAQPTCPELEILIETFDQLRLVRRSQLCLDSPPRLLVKGRSKPLLGFRLAL